MDKRSNLLTTIMHRRPRMAYLASLINEFGACTKAELHDEFSEKLVDIRVTWQRRPVAID